MVDSTATYNIAISVWVSHSELTENKTIISCPQVYENVMNFSKTLVAQYLQQRMEKAEGGGGLMAGNIQRLQSLLQPVEDVKTHDILVLLLRLRQICCLPGLISSVSLTLAMGKRGRKFNKLLVGY